MANLIGMFPGLAKMPYVRKFLNRSTVDGVDVSCIERVLQLAEKEHGWKGKNSRAAEEQAIIAALELLDKFSQAGVPMPSITLHSDGSFGFSWTGGGLVADVSVFGDGTYSYNVLRDGQIARASNRRTGEKLRPDLIRILLGSEESKK